MKFIKDKVFNKTTRGLFINSGSEVAVELAAITGFDWVILDMEHGLGDESQILASIRALESFPTAPLVRIPVLREEYIKKALDFGASGIICPMVNSEEMATNLVKFSRYAPQGIRGMTAASRAANYGKNFKDYFSKANTNLLIIAQIEDEEGVDAADKIASVDGIDMLFIGHSDLSLSLGCHGSFDDPLIIQAENKVLQAVKKYNKIAGMYLRPIKTEAQYNHQGFKFIALGSDTSCLLNGFKNLLN